MNRCVRRGAPPDRCGDGIQHQLHPDTGNRYDQTLVSSGLHFTFSCICVETRRQIDQAKTHCGYTPAIVFAGMTMSNLVQPSHPQEDEVQQSDVSPGFVRKVVELQSVSPYL